ncbi:MAG: 30S ribosomal protein S18 [bacterium]|nr:30S ribosomal protein S18 [bacterium]
MAEEKRKPFKKFKPFRKKYCKFCKDGIVYIDYKDASAIESYLTDRGKIVSGKITGTCAKHQRQLTSAIKILRNLALLPYTTVKYKK